MAHPTRRLLIILPFLALAACGGSPTAVDVNNLPPLSGKEQALMAAADGALRSNDTTSAIRDYQSAIGQSSGHVEAHLALARIYLEQKNTGSAKEVLERALALQPKNDAVNYLYGKILLDENKPADAEKHFAAGLESNPSNTELLNGSGVANDMLAQHAAAQARYQRAISLAAEDEKPMLRTNLAMSYLLAGEPQKAINLIKKDAKKPDASPVTKDNLALAYTLLGKNAEAKAVSTMSEDDRLQAVERLKAYLK